MYISAANGDRSLSETEHCGKSKKKKKLDLLDLQKQQ